MKKQGKKSSTRKKRQIPPKEKGNERKTWVDDLGFESVAEADTSRRDFPGRESGEKVTLEKELVGKVCFSVISWNVLAEAYCSRKSQRDLPPQYQKVVFSHVARKKRIINALESFSDNSQVDCMCLQEVDLEQIGQSLRLKGYEGVESPRTKGGGAGGRTDACAIYVKRKAWKILQHRVVLLDNLATLSSAVLLESESTMESVSQSHPTDTSTSQQQATGPSVSRTATCSNIQGIQQAFLRRNMALLARLQHVKSGKTLLVVNTHLYWNPGYEHVKLCQAHYILLKAKEMLNPGETIVFCGDLNSRPTGITHTYLTQGYVNAKRMAPWYAQSQPEDTEEDALELNTPASAEVDEALSNGVSRLTLAESTMEQKNETDKPLKVRYLLDATLNKLCRWLRMLGQDAALETDEEEKRRTKDGEMVIFDRCRSEHRTLVTTSTRLVLRRDCPSSTYCINPNFLPCLEVAMVHMFLTHGVILEPAKFLSRCVVCNGNIVEVSNNDEKRRILSEYQAPTDLGDELEVYECDGCKQGYWWNERPTSSASRVKSATSRLFELCIQGGVTIKGELEMFDNVDVDEQRQKGWDSSMRGSELLHQRLDVIDWLRDERLECPFDLTSAYGQKDCDAPSEIIPFTNVTKDFVNTLDYIFFEKNQLVLEDRLHVPTSFLELNNDELPNGHLLPSNVWPSDHLAVGARFSFRIIQEPVEEVLPMFCAPVGFAQANIQEPVEEVLPMFCTPVEFAQANTQEPVEEVLPMFCAPVDFVQAAAPVVHKRRCDCGCVPPILSLFEMAELRKQAKLAKLKSSH